MAADGQSSPVSDGGVLSVRIASRVIDAQDIVTLELQSLSSVPLPKADVGAHIDVHIAEAGVRQYSLVGKAGVSDAYRIAILRDPRSRGGSVWLHDEVKVGDVLTISTPRNHFPLRPCDGRVLLLAAGIGITPLLGMAQELADAGRNYALHYAARTPDHMAFRDVVSQFPTDKTHFYFSDGPNPNRLDLTQVLAGAGPQDQLYVCGPQRFIDAALAEATAQGWTSDRIHREYFGADLPVATIGGVFQVKLARSGAIYDVAPDQSIADVLIANGVPVSVSCAQGVCGTCLTGLLAGEPEHHDLFLTDAEHALNDQITPCCARSKSPLLVLDL